MNLKDALLNAGLQVSKDPVDRKEFDSVQDVDLPYCLDKDSFSYLDIFQDVKFFEAHREPLTMAWMKEHGMIPMERDRVYNWVQRWESGVYSSSKIHERWNYKVFRQL